MTAQERIREDAPNNVLFIDRVPWRNLYLVVTIEDTGKQVVYRFYNVSLTDNSTVWDQVTEPVRYNY